MTDFDLVRTREELQAALDALRDEVVGNPHSERARADAGVHVGTALLLLRGSTLALIVGASRTG